MTELRGFGETDFSNPLDLLEGRQNGSELLKNRHLNLLVGARRVTTSQGPFKSTQSRLCSSIWMEPNVLTERPYSMVFVPLACLHIIMKIKLTKIPDILWPHIEALKTKF